jgi:4-amino-4-deoxy-L-arabinose transferase-like glycosyltransferase
MAYTVEKTDAPMVAHKQSRREDARAILLLALVGIPLFSVTCFFRELWSPDEIRYAAIAREMAETGNWMVPHLNGEVYSEKPPLHFWLAALSARVLGGFSNFSMILPSVLSAIGCMITTYFFGKKIFNRSVGIMSALVLATSSMFVGMAQYVRMDMLLVFLFTLALFCFYQGYHDRGKRTLYCLGFYALLGLTVMTKGPVGIVLAFMIIVPYLALRRDLRSLLSMRPLTGAGVIASMLLLWLVPVVSQAGWEYLQALFIKQNFQRGYDSWDHDQPFYFYLAYFPALFFPWFPFFVASLMSAKLFRRPSLPDSGVAFLGVWFGVVFVFFSLMSAKVPVYLLPLFPAASILVGQFCHKALAAVKENANLNRRFSASGYVLWLIFITAGVALLFGPRLKIIETTDKLASLIPFGVGLLGFVFWSIDKKKLALIVAGSFTMLMLVYSTWRIAPVVDARASLSPLGERVAAARKANERVGMFRCDRPSLYFFTGAQVLMLRDEDEVASFLGSTDRVLCVLEEDEYNRMAKRLNPRRNPQRRAYILDRVDLDGKNLVLVSQYPPQ